MELHQNLIRASIAAKLATGRGKNNILVPGYGEIDSNEMDPMQAAILGPAMQVMSDPELIKLLPAANEIAFLRSIGDEKEVSRLIITSLSVMPDILEKVRAAMEKQGVTSE